MLAGTPAAQTLVDAIRNLSLSHDLRSIMGVISQSAGNLIHAEGVTFVLREGNQVYFADEQAVTPLVEGVSIPGRWLYLRLEYAASANRRDTGCVSR